VRARQDSIARAEEEARARAAAERAAEQRRADSLATLRRQSADVNTELASLIHFDFDKALLRPGDERVLDEKIPILQANTQVRIRVAGNCDERGSDEYNLALGNRRAISAKQYLVAHGIDASRIEVVSYGKERPIEPGHNAEAWAMNRNDQFDNLTTNVVLR
jgi:peptidoglycan-associated lipoprotein